jgi:hypothetical protein
MNPKDLAKLTIYQALCCHRLSQPMAYLQVNSDSWYPDKKLRFWGSHDPLIVDKKEFNDHRYGYQN